jgi:Ca2+/Na+ antiporter
MRLLPISSFINLGTMANADTVVYSIAVFVSTLFLLEFGADTFIDHTAVVARRTGISETIVGLVTAGAEWEEVRCQMRTIQTATLVHY